MPLRNKIFDKKTVENIGLNTSVTAKYARFLNKDGTPNVITRGASRADRYSIYHLLINMRNWKFALLVVAFYTAINFVFALVYYIFCMGHLQGIIGSTELEKFEEAYFFSSQTLTTVGYGRVSPVGFITNTIASLEALIGILTLAIVTGLLHGRFVKPRAFVRFSHNAVIAPFKGGKALMFRVAPIKNANMAEVSITVTASLLLEENGRKDYKYFPLTLQFSTINSLYITWTVVHPIDENSPLQGLTMQDLHEADFEMMVYLKAFDEDFANTVIARTSYTYDEIINGAKFSPVFYESPDGKGTVVEHHKLNQYTMVETAAI